MLVKDVFLIQLLPESGAASWSSTLKQQLETGQQPGGAFRVHLLPLTSLPDAAVGGPLDPHQLHLLLPLTTLDPDTLLVAEGAGAALLLDYLRAAHQQQTLPPLGGVVLWAVASHAATPKFVSADALEQRATGLPAPVTVLAAGSPLSYVAAAIRALLPCLLVTSTGLLLG